MNRLIVVALSTCFSMVMAIAQTQSSTIAKNAMVLGATPNTKTTTSSKNSLQIPKSALKLFTKSEQNILYKQFAEAKNNLQKAIKKYPKYVEAYSRLGDVNLELKDYEAAKNSFLKILNIDSSNSNQFKVYFTIGKIEYQTHNFEKALTYFKKCSLIPNLLSNYKQMNNSWLEQSEFAAYSLKNPVSFNPIRLDSTINSPFDEYLPALTADEQFVVFTRRLSEGTKLQEDFYFSEKSDSLHWKMALNMGKVINTAENEGAICLSPDGKRLFFAADNRKDTEGGFDIYYCIKHGDEWSKPYNIGYPINTGSYESQPSISADGRWLYFCSKRKGGYGGMDIWASYLNDTNFWNEPVNLGAFINTEKDEQTPFIHPDNNTLYFSSNGHTGMGDADLYLTRKDSAGNWTKPTNLGYPINTTGNENGLVVSASGEKAYYSSYNKNYGLDLFMFNLPKTAKPTFVTYVKGLVTDQKTKKPISATINLIDLETGKTILNTQSDAQNGEFLVTLTAGKNYMYNVNKNGYLFHSENFLINKESADKPYLINIALQPINNTDYKNSIGETVVLKNVFFETGLFELKESSFLELNKLVQLLNEQVFMKIEIGGHTDNIGSKESNLSLSTKRAQSVYNYLINKGIDAKRLSYKGYADTKPLETNDTEQGRANNRRTEFRITEK